LAACPLKGLVRHFSESIVHVDTQTCCPKFLGHLQTPSAMLIEFNVENTGIVRGDFDTSLIQRTNSPAT